MSRFLNSRLARLSPYTPGEQPRDMARLIKLNTNENPYPPGPLVQQALAQARTEDLARYPDPECTGLCQAAAQLYGLEPSQVLAGNGSDELLAFCFQAFGGSGICTPELGYGFYPVFADLYGAALETLALNPDFTLSPSLFRGKKQTLLLANPNAPTGLWLDMGQIRALLEQDRQRLLILDEAYGDFAPATALPLLAGYDNLLLIRTLSKAYSLAGARLGLALGSPALISDLKLIQYSFNPYNVNRISQALGAAALQDQAYFQRCRNRILASREKLRQGLLELGFSVPPSAANFLLAGAQPKISGQAYSLALRERQILVRHFPEKRVADYVRISIGREAEMAALLQATENILEAR